ncbi:MAG: hypothetical protein ACE5H1_10010, partial [Thermodesulfobacteriota bacterium]
GVGGGGSSSYIPPQEAEFTCSAWEECINGRQFRTCTDVNDNSSFYDEEQRCITATTTTLSTTTTIRQEPIEIEQPSNRVLYITITLVVIVALAAISIANYLLKKPRKPKNKLEAIKFLRKHVQSNIRHGFNKKAIRKTALRQGWPAEVVDKVLRK